MVVLIFEMFINYIFKTIEYSKKLSLFKDLRKYKVLFVLFRIKYLFLF